MGMYMYVNEQDRIDKRKVVGNDYLYEEFQAALKCCPSLMIDSHNHVEYKGLFRKKVLKTYYSIYHETPAFDGTPYQARYQFSACSDVQTIIAYLHGIINGYHSANNLIK
jgi:hypothetical protein